MHESTWVFRCLALTDTAAAELSALLDGGLWCSAAASLAALLPMLLTEVRSMTTSCTCTSCSCGRWAAAAVDALAWVAVAATAGVHCMEVASGIIGLAAHPVDNTYLYVDVVLAAVCLPVDLLAGLILWCSLVPRPRQLGEQG